MFKTFKKMYQLKKGDIIKTQYGDYNNWIIVKINSVEKDPDHDAWYVINCHDLMANETFNTYHHNSSIEEVVEVIDELEIEFLKNNK